MVGTEQQKMCNISFLLNQAHTTEHRVTHGLTNSADPYLPWVARRWTHSGTMRVWDREEEKTNKNKTKKQNKIIKKSQWQNQMRRQIFKDADNGTMKGTLCCLIFLYLQQSLPFSLASAAKCSSPENPLTCLYSNGQ